MRRGTKWALAGLGAMVLAVGLLVIDVHRRASATFERHAARSSQELADLCARSAARPPATGAAVPGNAWDLYANVFEALAGLTKDEQAAIPEVDGTWEWDDVPDDQRLNALFAKYEPMIGRWREGVRRRDVDPPRGPVDPVRADLQAVLKAVPAFRFLEGAIAHHARMGNPAESFELAALGLQVAQDLERRGGMVHMAVRLACENLLLERCRYLLHEGFLPGGAELAQFADRLEAMGGGRPDPRAFWDVEFAALRHVLLRPLEAPSEETLYRTPDAPGWRQVFSERVARAQALNALDGCAAGLRALFDVPRDRRQEAIWAWDQDWHERAGPLACLLELPFEKVGICREENQLLLARLRATVAVARFRVDHGAQPEALAELVPRYLPSIPSDRWGAPLVLDEEGRVQRPPDSKRESTPYVHPLDLSPWTWGVKAPRRPLF